ncbi:hypothetical protein Anapl_17546 [Anas platyrhynchos]|uniref:Uncharacterized protein n=1 Tax=Anas platyrhynchos TaxID=8839 RepID=R0L8K7_ANAPL|nr:hypothetical protein Anapl_17546 [Anas platyrhynchos]
MNFRAPGKGGQNHQPYAYGHNGEAKTQRITCTQTSSLENSSGLCPSTVERPLIQGISARYQQLKINFQLTRSPFMPVEVYALREGNQTKPRQHRVSPRHEKIGECWRISAPTKTRTYSHASQAETGVPDKVLARMLTKTCEGVHLSKKKGASREERVVHMSYRKISSELFNAHHVYPTPPPEEKGIRILLSNRITPKSWANSGFMKTSVPLETDTQETCVSFIPAGREAGASRGTLHPLNRNTHPRRGEQPSSRENSGISPDNGSTSPTRCQPFQTWLEPRGSKRNQEEPGGISQLAAHPGPCCALQHADPEMFPSLPGGRSPLAPLLEANYPYYETI